MIIISAGLQKSGTGFFFNITNDLLVAAGKDDIREIRERFSLEEVLKYYNCNIGDLNWGKIKKIMPLYLRGKTFVIKTHNQPNKWVNSLMAMRVVKATFIYRDPRDVVLSAIDHGKKIKEEGLNHTFATCSTIESTIPQVELWLRTTIPWMDLKGVLLLKYEDLLSDPVLQLKRLSNFLRIDVDEQDIRNILDKYDYNKLENDVKDYLHFNVGRAGRFHGMMDKKDLDACNRVFSPYLERMGYDI
jgi:hypothetical protein